ncbi:hypothetical protein [Halobaculum sp. MBLA0143]|uniref:DUF7091 family protein n=1 Tax=Halobaculum sp. MBLA0143 TaxID=3079933 RepID=UPI003523448B
MGDRLRRVLRQQARRAGRQYAESRSAYREARDAAERVDPREFDLPADADGDARIVCRRYAERRSVPVDANGRPACFEAGVDDCEGCAEDIREGRVQTY